MIWLSGKRCGTCTIGGLPKCSNDFDRPIALSGEKQTELAETRKKIEVKFSRCHANDQATLTAGGKSGQFKYFEAALLSPPVC